MSSFYVGHVCFKSCQLYLTLKHHRLQSCFEDMINPGRYISYTELGIRCNSYYKDMCTILKAFYILQHNTDS